MSNIKNYMLSRILSLMLIGIVGIYMYSQAVYTHQHILKDGTIITHAHPYDKSDSKPFKSHHHSQSELILLSVLKVLFFTSSICFAFITIGRSERLFEYSVILNCKNEYHYKAVRAPPVL
jgi:hypothetical protein